MPKFWQMLSIMIEDNYQTSENQEATMLLGLCVHHSAKEVRQNWGISPNSKLIAYQFEPLVENHWHNRERIIKNLDGADEVWDYDLENIEYLRSKGIDAKFKPLAFSNRLKRIENKQEKDIDILFFGTLTNHRYDTISSFLNGFIATEENINIFAKLNFVWLYNIDDERLDDYISRSKLILNLKPNKETYIQQQTRIFYPLINDKCILSEKSSINYFGDSIQQFSGFNQMCDKIYNIFRYEQWKVPPNQHWFANNFTKSKMAIFIHVYQFANWQQIFEEQIVKLQQSGLYDNADYIHIGINGSAPLPYEFYKFNRVKYNTNIDLEADTLSDLQSFCISNPDYKVLYLHSKGVTHFGHSSYTNIESWRRYLEHFVVSKWRDCIEKLDEYDTVGTEWEIIANIANTEIFSPHYAGNFWWANAGYVSKLNRDFLYERNNWPRWQGEFWIGTENPKYFNFKTTGKNKYYQLIDQSEYME